MERLIFWIYRAISGAVAMLPLDVAFGLGLCLGRIGWWLLPPYRALVLANLTIAFGEEKSPAEIRRLGAAVFARLGANLFSGLKMAEMPPEEAAERVAQVHGERMQALIASGRKIVGAINHIGNWEAFSLMPLLIPGPRFATVYQRLGNRLIDADVRRTRGRVGVGTFERKAGFKAPVAFLKSGGLLAVLIDQHAGDGGVWTPFFGRLASTSPLAATLATLGGAALIPVSVRTVGWARWEMEFEAPVEVGERDAGAVTAELNAVLEGQVRRSPEDWFWVHNRWKTPAPRFLIADYKRGISLPCGMDETDLKPFRLVVRSSNWLGDAVMQTPAVRAIKAGRPDLRLTVLCREKLAGYWRNIGEVDEVLPIGGGDSIWAVARNLRAGKFDAALVLPNSIRSALEPFLAGIPRRVGRPGPSRRPLLNQRYQPKKQKPGPPRHQVHDHLDLARFIGAPTDRKRALAFPARKAPERDRPVIGICPGAEYGPAKRWPAERFAKAAQLVGERLSVDWVLFGVAKDAEFAGVIASALAPRCDNLVGRTSLEELIGHLSRCHRLLTNDTGTMHLAAALGVPVVAIFGSTEQRLTGPMGDGHRVVRRHAHCSPCFLRECPMDLRCLLDITPEEVAEALLESLAGARSRG